ncbi:4-galactosyl-N-acetylglucosaminide 3-alpha-L-fucosyltransferase 9-like [Solea solea]|uniref:4-galactosyl-N-acetylglucosaminide 3-alpha-L-fucosyltransferase 9-like n=1 Tax=Solea solea TaxID=90069 RepID=UPI00272CE464|nr:4-galactosyl-N-acetylglucosaminide 3-alpha-L-fucosyltransferase 9-like [Solea solea]
MASTPSSTLRPLSIVVVLLAGVIILFTMYYRSFPVPKCHPAPKPAAVQKQSVATNRPKTKKPLVLLWFWPESKKFDLKDCKNVLEMDHCELTDDRSLYSKAHAVLIHHNDIKDDLSNLPTTPRPKFQRWIWLSMDTPPNTRKIAGIEALFNLTSSYRKDADIPVRWHLTVKKNPGPDFVPPKKERVLCWIVNSNDLNTTSAERYNYYNEVIKHMKVDVFDISADNVKGENYFQTISTCKFFLSFEESNHRDYITETFYGPLAVGTVPIVLGPPRKNYEKFVPGTSFIHVKDFPDAFALAEFLLKLDDDKEAYEKYFTWHRFYTLRRHFTDEQHKFTLAVCQACRHIGFSNEYRVVRDLYKWVSQ